MRTIQAAKKLAVKQHPVRHKAQPKPSRRAKVADQRRRHAKAHARASAGVPFPIFVASVSVLTVGIMVNVAQHALISQLGYEVESVKKEIQLAQQEQDKLLARKSLLESPERVESVAVNKLSMVKAPKVSYLQLLEIVAPAHATPQTVAYSSQASAGKDLVNGSNASGRGESTAPSGTHAVTR